MLVRSDGMLVRVGLPKPERRELMAGAVERADGFGDLARRLRLYFQGERVEFSDVPVRFEGLGPVEERVLRETMRVPYGRLTTYSALAGAVGSPGAARAVGNAMSRNPMPIIVPCHRVVRSDGSIGGYSAGTLVKRRLLALEGIGI
jgi:methylated-DNA-[protein]-cysteine S-methyltransferase